jgi:ubiquitin carboxyl-terminal hydrolase 1
MNEEDANEGIEGEDALQQKRDAWWRLSDDDVTQVGEDFVLRQGGVFMLFYERADDVIVESKTAAPAPVQESMAADVAAEDAARIPLPAGDDEDLDSVLVNEDTLPPGPHTPLTEDPSFPEAHLPSEEEKPTSSSHLLPTPPQSPTSISESDLDSIADDVPVASGFNAPAPAQAIKMRTANVFADDRSRGSNESLLMGSRMVSAS